MKTLFEFSSFNDWVNHAPQRYASHAVTSKDTICLDAKGRECHRGADMTLRKPRKMPKNQRAYPKKGKPRIVEVTHAQCVQLAKEDIGAPVVYFDNGRYYVKAGEWRKWLAGSGADGGAES